MVVIEPGCSEPYRDSEWSDVLIEIDLGQIELEMCTGTRHRLSAGELFWLRGLAVRVLHNDGLEPAVLVTLARTSPASRRIAPG